MIVKEKFRVLYSINYFKTVLNTQKQRNTKMKKMFIRCTLLEEALGMTPSSEEALQTFMEIRKKKLEKKWGSIEGKVAEEMKIIQANIDSLKDENRKGLSIFPKDLEGNPIFWDYQIRGFFKDQFRALKDVQVDSFKGFKKTPAVLVDRAIFVGPRIIKIQLPEGTEVEECTRILRTPKNNNPDIHQTAFKVSESVPAGSIIKFAINVIDESYVDHVMMALEYGAIRGFGEWRNSGKGIFRFEIYNEEKKEWVEKPSRFVISEEIPE